MADIEAVLLGTAQDAGVPQAGCLCSHCQQARSCANARRWAASLGLVHHPTRRFWMVDATPDFREQYDFVASLYPGFQLAGLLLTHAHIGHYTGLVHLGQEVMDVSKLPVYVSERMAGFLQENKPWSGLVARNNLVLRRLDLNTPLELESGLSITPIPVPHRDEWSDTLAFAFSGSGTRLFYCPDIDSWDGWLQEPCALLDGFGAAVLDGTFFSPDEIAGRDLRQIPHPTMQESVQLLEACACQVIFTHLNHTNPVLDPGPERIWLEGKGFEVGFRGQRWEISAAL